MTLHHRAAANHLPAGAPELWCWRHPPARGAAGRCIGRTELRVDPRRARRLARRIRAQARRHGLPRAAWVSPRSRCRDVGRALRRLGFQVRVDARLTEMDFGRWDGRRWDDIPAGEIGAWADDLLDHAPGGGETLRALARRAQEFAAVASRFAVPATPARASAALPPGASVIVVTHGGWINALAHVDPAQDRLPAADWPAPPRHGALVRLRPGRAGSDAHVRVGVELLARPGADPHARPGAQGTAAAGAAATLSSSSPSLA
jgi:alpha-ribazole phosphatase